MHTHLVPLHPYPSYVRATFCPAGLSRWQMRQTCAWDASPKRWWATNDSRCIPCQQHTADGNANSEVHVAQETKANWTASSTPSMWRQTCDCPGQPPRPQSREYQPNGQATPQKKHEARSTKKHSSHEFLAERVVADLLKDGSFSKRTQNSSHACLAEEEDGGRHQCWKKHPTCAQNERAANHRIKERNGCGPNHHVKRMALRTILEHLHANVAAQVDTSSEKADSLDRKETFHPCFTSRLVSLRTSQAISAASCGCVDRLWYSFAGRCGQQRLDAKATRSGRQSCHILLEDVCRKRGIRNAKTLLRHRLACRCHDNWPPVAVAQKQDACVLQRAVWWHLP